MATLKELVERTLLLVDDESLEENFKNFLNQGVYEIAGGMQSATLDVITPPLPELFTIEAVTTDAVLPYVDMPVTYQRDLNFVASAKGTEIDIENSFIEFSETYPALDRKGIISSAIEHGNKLYYQGIPLAQEEINLHFYRKPVKMVANDDTPDGIPEHLQMSLLTNFAAWKAFELIEDDVEGDSPNTIKYRGLFFEALKTLELTITYDFRMLKLR